MLVKLLHSHQFNLVNHSRNFFFIIFLSTISFSNLDAAVNDSVVLDSKVARKLSDYGFFDDLNSQKPTNGVLPYELITPLFSDYADKLRFIYVPDNAIAEHRPNKVFDFPEGTVLIKTFAYLNDHEASDLPPQLLETRLLIKKNSDPTKKDGLKKYYIYSVKGKDMGGDFDVLRRYNDFHVTR